MDIGSLFTKVFLGMVVVIIFMTFINYTLPMYKKIQVQEIGREFLGEMELDNGLKNESVDLLKNELSQKGLENIVVYSTMIGSVSFGGKLYLRIETDFPYRKYGVFSSEIERVPIIFEQSIISRRVAP